MLTEREVEEIDRTIEGLPGRLASWFSEHRADGEEIRTRWLDGDGGMVTVRLVTRDTGVADASVRVVLLPGGGYGHECRMAGGESVLIGESGSLVDAVEGI
jgi:hypothetical protein